MPFRRLFVRWFDLELCELDSLRLYVQSLRVFPGSAHGLTSRLILNLQALSGLQNLETLTEAKMILKYD